MGKKDKETTVDVRRELLKSPPEIVAVLKDQADDLEFTKVVQTFVSENDHLQLELTKEGKSFFSGIVLWIGNRQDGNLGTEICVKDDDGETKTIVPTTATTQEIILNLKKKNKPLLSIATISRERCAVCGKGIEIFDESTVCPICGARAHTNHMYEWIKKKNSCPMCNKPLKITGTGEVVIA